MPPPAPPQDRPPRRAASAHAPSSPSTRAEGARRLLRDGLGLPEAWRGRASFALGEVGFGDGAGFLAAWDLWSRDPARPARLHHVAAESAPPGRDALARALAGLSGPPGAARALVDAWPGAVPGFHRIAFEGGRVSLTLVLGPVAPALAEIEAGIDAWILRDAAGGASGDAGEAAPEATAREIARLSRPGAPLAAPSFASGAAPALLAALATAGLGVEDAGPGWVRARAGRPAPGPVRDRDRGRAPWFRPPPGREPARALVVGGGIAGAAAAEALARRGWRVTLFERRQRPAAEGSGTPAGIVMPRLVLGDGPERRFHAQAFAHALRALAPSPAFRATGVLHLGADPALAHAGILPADRLLAVGAAEAARLVGLPVPGPGLWLPEAGWLDPAAEVARLAASADLRCGVPVASLERAGGLWVARGPDGRPLAEAEIAVLAGGLDCRAFPQARWLPLVPRKGQATLLGPSPAGARLRAAVAGAAYAIPAPGGGVVAGATFDPVADAVPAPAAPAEPEADARNLAALRSTLPSLFGGAGGDPPVLGGRAALRATTPDHLPLAGPLPDRDAWLRDYGALRTGDRRARFPSPALHDGLYLLAGLGARGLTTAPLAAELVASIATGEPWPVPRSVAEALHPGRSIVRDLRRRKA